MRQRSREAYLHDLRGELRHWRDRARGRLGPQGEHLLERVDAAVDRLQERHDADEATWRSTCEAIDEAWSRFHARWRRERAAGSAETKPDKEPEKEETT